MKRVQKKTIRFSVRLKGIGAKPKAKLRRIGMDENLTLLTQEVVFTDKRGLGFDTAMFALAVSEVAEELCKKYVECVFEEVK